jgi:hypothetical protein
MKIPIDVLIIGIVSLSLILAILSIYMVLKGKYCQIMFATLDSCM